MRYRDRSQAADYLTNQLGVRTTAQGLADHAHKDTGPRYSLINGRALYLEADLNDWVERQAARPIARKVRARQQAAR
jgi:hypothetical protein